MIAISIPAELRFEVDRRLREFQARLAEHERRSRRSEFTLPPIFPMYAQTGPDSLGRVTLHGLPDEFVDELVGAGLLGR